MAAVLAYDIFNCIFLNENIRILIGISMKIVPVGSIKNIPALVQVMAWHWTGRKALLVPIMVKFTDAYMRHSCRDIPRKVMSTSMVIIVPADGLAF